MTEWIGAAEAAERLGIKPASLYAYVSRGLLSRRREADGRASMFSADEVAELARKGRPRRPAGAAELVIESALTEITADTQRYRGYDATELALSRSFEDVAMLLWTAALPGPGEEANWRATPEALAAGAAAQAALPPGTLPLERLQVIVPAQAATDQFRLHLDEPAVVAAGRALIAGMVGALPPSAADAPAGLAGPALAGITPGSFAGGGALGSDADGASNPAGVVPGSVAAGGSPAGAPGPVAGGDAAGVAPGPVAAAGGSPADGGAKLADAGGDGPAGADSIATRLAARLCVAAPGPGLARVLNAALVLVADHELAASTLAARVAASMRADPYAVVATGLGAMGGALHGGAALGAELMLTAAESPADVPRVVGELLRRGEKLPGFGHFVYKEGDPRANLLLELVTEYAPQSPQLAIASAVIAEVRQRALPEPNIEFALAVLTTVAGMVRGAGEAIFATGRASGWLAHALEEYARNIPIRPRSIFTGQVSRE
jgi:citrate synthase